MRKRDLNIQRGRPPAHFLNACTSVSPRLASGIAYFDTENTMYFFGLWFLCALSAKALNETHIVYPRLLEERSTDGVMVMRVHDELTLSLRKASVAAPELRVLTEEDGKTVTEIYNGEEIEKNMYEDADKIATVTVTKDDQGVYMNGLVGPRHRIEPLPLAERSQDGAVAHAIYEIEYPEMLDRTLRLEESDKEPLISERSSGQQEPPVPEEVEIELFFISDIPHNVHFVSKPALLLYLCVMVNSVSLRYRAAKDPKISLRVTGVDMPTTESYVSPNAQNMNYLYDKGTLQNLVKYAYDKAQDFNYPDVTYLITGRDVYTNIDGTATNKGQGISNIWSVCTQTSVALGEDKAGFYTGMFTLTHELAHVLGAVHDGEEPLSEGHPGALKCPHVGFIMSYADTRENHNHFSECTLQQIRYVVRKAGTYCWQVRSNGYAIPGKYPGMLISQLAYCKHVVNDATFTVSLYTVIEQTCKIRCILSKNVQVEKNGKIITETRSSYQDANALDYTVCGSDSTKVCIQGKCVTRPSDT